MIELIKSIIELAFTLALVINIGLTVRNGNRIESLEKEIDNLRGGR